MTDGGTFGRYRFLRYGKNGIGIGQNAALLTQTAARQSISLFIRSKRMQGFGCCESIQKAR